MSTLQKQPAHPLASIVGLASAAGGWLFSNYTGASGWIPLGSALFLLVIFSKTPLKPKWFVGAIIATLAHVIWFTAAGVLAGIWSTVLVDITFLLGLAILLWIRPGFVSALLLGLVQAASLAYNIYSISQVQFGELTHRALTSHIAMRLIALAGLVVGYLNYRKGRAQLSQEQVPPMP